jgi:hypothetical protein
MRAFAATVGVYAVTIGAILALARHYAATLPGLWAVRRARSAPRDFPF